MSDGADVHVLYGDADARAAEAPIHPQERRPFCAHRQIRLDNDAHRVFCRNCDVEVEPFQVLQDLAHDWSRWEDARGMAEREAKAARARLDDLLREERNAKARKRRRESA